MIKDDVRKVIIEFDKEDSKVTGLSFANTENALIEIGSLKSKIRDENYGIKEIILKEG